MYWNWYLKVPDLSPLGFIWPNLNAKFDIPIVSDTTNTNSLITNNPMDLTCILTSNMSVTIGFWRIDVLYTLTYEFWRFDVLYSITIGFPRDDVIVTYGFCRHVRCLMTFGLKEILTLFVEYKTNIIVIMYQINYFLYHT